MGPLLSRWPFSSAPCSSLRLRLARPERFRPGNFCGLGGAVEFVFPSEFDEFFALQLRKQVDAAEGALDQLGQFRRQAAAVEAKIVLRRAGGGPAHERAGGQVRPQAPREKFSIVKNVQFSAAIDRALRGIAVSGVQEGNPKPRVTSKESASMTPVAPYNKWASQEWCETVTTTQ